MIGCVNDVIPSIDLLSLFFIANLDVAATVSCAWTKSTRKK
jgi:hypothetical protein